MGRVSKKYTCITSFAIKLLLCMPTLMEMVAKNGSKQMVQDALNDH
jgi:hypothetical protein